MSFRAPRTAALCLLAAGSLSAYVGQWRSYTDKSRVTALVEHNGHVYAGTQGGIRRVHPASLEQRDFDNLDGLLDPWITGFARDGAGRLWAVGRQGYVYLLSGGRWETWGRSYASQQWRMNDRAVLAQGSHLYLGSQKGLAVFDADRKVSQLNLTRFGSAVDVPVLSLLRRGDTLYAGTPAGVYKARVHFADPVNPPAGQGSLADPSRWTLAVPAEPGRRFDHLAFIGDSLATFGPGTLLHSPVYVEAFPGTPLVIGSHAYPERTTFVTAVHAGGKVFAGGDAGLVVSANPAAAAPDAQGIAPLRRHSRDTIANIGAHGGRVWGHSPSGLWRLDPGPREFLFEPPPIAPQEELYLRSLRNTKVDANGDVYVGSWGAGLFRQRDGTTRTWRKATDPCLIEVIDNFPVVHALGQPRGKHLFFSMFTGAVTHQLAYLNTSPAENPQERVACLDSTVPGTHPHAVHAFSDTLLGVASDRGLALFKIREGAQAPQLEPAGLWTLTGSAVEAWDLAADRWGRAWVLAGPGLAHVDSLGLTSSFRLTPIDNFLGENCKSLESDPDGWLWVGCQNGLFHVRTRPEGELASVRRYGPDDGLLSQMIYDVSVDPANGRVWIATDRGVSMLQSSAQPPIPSGELAEVVPYPNPFRPHHRFVVFDNLPRNSTLRIHDASGQVVRIFHPRDLTGNQAQWDGANESGRRVAPGVYLFSVTSGAKVQRGKVIVAR